MASYHLNNDMDNLSMNDSFPYLRTHRNGCLNIVAIGKTGEGKSATINTMIWHSKDPKPKFFNEGESPYSVMKAHNECTVKLFGLNCRLIDTIGLFDTELSSEQKADFQPLMPGLEEVNKSVIKNLADIITLCRDRIDAFLFVVDGSGRTTYKMIKTIRVIQRYLGVAMLDHCVFVLTNADRAENGTLQKMEEAISRYLICINYFDIDERFVHFDNKRRPQQHVTKLLKVIEKNLKKRNGHPYSYIACLNAQDVSAEEKQSRKGNNDMDNLSMNNSFPYLHTHRNGCLNIVAIGKTGEGKSATINTMISYSKNPKPKFFNEGESPYSVMKAYNECTVKLFGLNCRLIDTIKLFDAELSPEQKADFQPLIPDLEEDNKSVIKDLADIITLCSDRIDAFLFVVDGSGRMTYKMIKTIRVIQRFLGVAMLDHCIFVLTSKFVMQLERESSSKISAHFFCSEADRAKNGTLEKMEEAISRYLNGINYFDIDGRFVHFDNKRRPQQHVTKLLKVIEKNLKKRNGHPYSYIAFQHAQDVSAEEKQSRKVNNDMDNLSMNNSFPYLHTHRNGCLNIVAIGKTGEGKSATINTMISYSTGPKPKFFNEGESPYSVTKAYYECSVKLFGLKCRLIDTIGLFETELISKQEAGLQFFKIPDLAEDNKSVLKNLADIITLCSDGIDAFLFVIDGSARMTYEMKETINVIQRFLGVAMLDCCIFVLTSKLVVQLESESSSKIYARFFCSEADRAENGTLEKMEEAISHYLNGINYFDIGDRFVHFDNKRRPQQHVTKLLKVIEKNLKKRNGHPYSHIAFQHAQNVLAEEKQNLREELNAELQKHIAAVTEKIKAEYDKQMKVIQDHLGEKSQQITNLRAEAVEERKRFQSEIDGLNTKMVEIEKHKHRDIEAAVQQESAKCNEMYLEKFRHMENSFQEQNQLLLESNQTVAQLQAATEKIKAEYNKKMKVIQDQLDEKARQIMEMERCKKRDIEVAVQQEIAKGEEQMRTNALNVQELAREKQKFCAEMEAKVDRFLTAIAEQHNKQLRVIQDRLGEKAQQISNLQKEAVEERKRFQSEIDGLNAKMVEIEKCKQRDIEAVVQQESAKCDEMYLEEFRHMENSFQEQNQLLLESNQTVVQLQSKLLIWQRDQQRFIIITIKVVVVSQETVLLILHGGHKVR